MIIQYSPAIFRGCILFLIKTSIMNKKNIYFILIALFFGSTAFVVLRYNNKLKNRIVASYPFKERTGSAALLPEWSSTKSRGVNLMRIVRETPEDTKSTLALATLYL